jgi:hypothetical protein
MIQFYLIRLPKILSKYNEVRFCFEDLVVKNNMVQLNFFYDWFAIHGTFSFEPTLHAGWHHLFFIFVCMSLSCKLMVVW